MLRWRPNEDIWIDINALKNIKLRAEKSAPNLESHACMHTSTQCALQSCLKRRDWNQKETGEKQGGRDLNGTV